MPKDSTILIIRHCEKPQQRGEAGLSVEGLERAAMCIDMKLMYDDYGLERPGPSIS
jgi:hypothetical protein